MSLENSFFEVRPQPLSGYIQIPGSKSYANRLLILAAMNPKPVTLKNLPDSTDVLTMLECLKTIGIKVSKSDHNVCLHNSFPDCEKNDKGPLVVETGDGGTTTRFLMALLALGNRTYHIEPEGGMRERPLQEMLDVFKNLGVYAVKNEGAWLTLRGPLKLDGMINIDCSRSTQFASALALVLREQASIIRPIGMKTSQSYYEMTLELLKQADRDEYVVPLDFSSASYPLALGAVTGRVTLSNCLSADHYQADSIFIDILKKAKVNVGFGSMGLTIQRPEKLIGFKTSCASCPDLAPTLAYFASFCEGESHLYDLEVLEHKESDRFTEIVKVLSHFGIDYKTKGRSDIFIKGQKYSQSKKNSNEVLIPPPDHRIVMMSYLFMRTLGGGHLGNVQHVKKSFSNFFETMEEMHD